VKEGDSLAIFFCKGEWGGGRWVFLGGGQGDNDGTQVEGEGRWPHCERGVGGGGGRECLGGGATLTGCKVGGWGRVKGGGPGGGGGRECLGGGATLTGRKVSEAGGGAHWAGCCMTSGRGKGEGGCRPHSEGGAEGQLHDGVCVCGGGGVNVHVCKLVRVVDDHAQHTCTNCITGREPWHIMMAQQHVHCLAPRSQPSTSHSPSLSEYPPPPPPLPP